jgi:hypothetical protein
VTGQPTSTTGGIKAAAKNAASSEKEKMSDWLLARKKQEYKEAVAKLGDDDPFSPLRAGFKVKRKYRMYCFYTGTLPCVTYKGQHNNRLKLLPELRIRVRMDPYSIGILLSECGSGSSCLKN